MKANLLTLSIAALTAAAVLEAGSAVAQSFNSGSTGADGAFNPATDSTLTLPPAGVFNFTTISIPSGVTVTFIPNAANTPVTLLASGNVTIAGTIDVSGGPGGGATAGTNLVPNGGAGGPGGGAGGNGSNALVTDDGGAGLGPGGGGGGVAGFYDGGGAGGSFGTPGVSPTVPFASGAPAGAVYGSATLLPLIGGSGGGGGATHFGFTGGGGGGGGGALLIASSGALTFTGHLLAAGAGAGFAFGGCAGTSEVPGGGGGSGGAVRLIAATISGAGGSINVAGGRAGFGCNVGGGAGGDGRIRVEAFTDTSTITYTVAPALDRPSTAILPNAPSLSIASVAGIAAPGSPTGSYSTPDVTLPANTTNPVAVVVTAANVPPGTFVTITAAGLAGGRASATATLSGSSAASSASASVAIPTNEPSVISATATFTLAARDGGPVYVQGEEVDRVRVSATGSGAPQVAYVTKAGREIRGPLARIMREHTRTLTPTLSLSEGEGAISMPSPPPGERDRVRGAR